MADGKVRLMETPEEHDQLDAFADGELDETLHADAANRFRDDPESQKYASGVSRLKGSLTTMWSAESAPKRVRGRLSEVLAQAETPEARAEPLGRAVGTAHRKIRRSTWSPRRVSMLAMAATVVLVALIWQLLPQQRMPTVQVTKVSPRAMLTVTDQHGEAIDAGGVFVENRLIATTESEAERILSLALEIPVLAPDLSERGFAFLGAARCLIGRLPAAHLLYRHEQSEVLLSLFSVRKLERLRSRVTAAGVLEVFEAETKGLTSLGWHSGPATYLACASLRPAQLRSVLRLSLSVTQSWNHWPEGKGVPSLVMSEVSEYDALEQSGAAEADGPRKPANAPSPRRGATEFARCVEWIALVQRAIVMGCS